MKSTPLPHASAIACVASLMFCFAPATSAYSRALSTQPITTGLGECVDFLLYGSSTLANQVNTSGFTFEYGPNTRTARTAKKIYITHYTCPQAPPTDMTPLYETVSAVAHELGHAVSSPTFRPRIDTRQNYIDDYCQDEGLAVANNIVGRKEIRTTSQGAVDIGLIGNNAVEPQIEAIHAAYTPPESHRRMGKIFCDNNIESVTMQSYNDYYGSSWDERFGSGAQLASAGQARMAAPERKASGFDLYSFQKQVDQTSASTKKGGVNALRDWPVPGLVLPESNGVSFRRINGGAFTIGKAISIESSEIRLTPKNEVIIASWQIGPKVCVALSELRSHYPDLTLSTADIEPSYWTRTTADGVVAFGFSRDRPACLSEVVFNPSGK